MRSKTERGLVTAWEAGAAGGKRGVTCARVGFLLRVIKYFKVRCGDGYATLNILKIAQLYT